jgi:hypothetical protein
VPSDEHRWKVALHATTQVVPLQVEVPFVGAVQVAHDAPQAASVLLGTHVGAAVVPRRQKPGVLHTTWQLGVVVVEVSHTAIPLDAGAGHALHDAPHEVRAVLDTQVPVGPVAGQRWNPGLHAIPHVLAVHTADALGSDDAAQVEHPAGVPHCMVLSLGKHPLVAGQVWVPAPHIVPQAPFTHAVPVGHGVQSTPSMVPQ